MSQQTSIGSVIASAATSRFPSARSNRRAGATNSPIAASASSRRGPVCWALVSRERTRSARQPCSRISSAAVASSLAAAARCCRRCGSGASSVRS
ncbi:hypothetical protein [Propionicimonas sp.]|uniref:hypothetical protein n=1 Tax=Propionicimonas sp. TaxID=1955623 RepID=UPI0039E2685F